MQILLGSCLCTYVIIHFVFKNEKVLLMQILVSSCLSTYFIIHFVFKNEKVSKWC